DDRDATTGGEVRVCVRVRGGAVRGPARVTDRGSALTQGVVRKRLRKVHELARALGDIEALLVVGHHSDASGAVSAILEPRQPFHDHALRTCAGSARPDVSDDSAHAVQSSSRRANTLLAPVTARGAPQWCGERATPDTVPYARSRAVGRARRIDAPAP